MQKTPRDELAGLLSGYWYTQTIYVAAKLGIAEHLNTRPRSSQELSELTGTHPRALYRLLRALASLGVFAEDQGTFSLTPLSRCLLDPAIRAMAMMRGEFQYQAWGELLYSVQTGKPAFDKVYGKPMFSYLAEHPDMAEVFDQAMTGVHGHETQAMLDAYDFGRFGALADIGGGNGSVLMEILRRYPHMQGILFDLPGVVERTRASLEGAGLCDRCRAVAGDFFESDLPRADVYLMRHIIHDWDDDQAIALLNNCRRAMQPGNTLLLVEGVIPPGNEPAVSKFFDLAMLVSPGGMERTEGEYRQLLHTAGLRLERVFPTRTWVSVIEAV